MHRIFILSTTLLGLGCSNSAEQFKAELEQSQPAETEQVQIDLQAFELLGSMNETVKGKLRHRFFKAIENGNLTAYRDANSSIALTTIGSDGDFSLVEIIMPLKDFLPASGKQTDENAVRFCQCAIRLAKTIDPELESQATDLVNNHIDDAVSTEDGVFFKHKSLTVKFSSFANDKIQFINFAISNSK